jgi:uncharacterized membrane protein
LPEAPREPPPRTWNDLLDEEQRAANRRRQFIAVLAVAVVTIAAVLIFARFSAVRPAQRQQVAPATAVEP